MRFAPPLGLTLRSQIKPDQETHTHHECRECGKNLPAESNTCPRCNGEVAVYEW